MANELVLTARILETRTLRYTPAGVPVVDLRLEHESVRDQSGVARQIRAVLKAVAFGAVAERLVRQVIGSDWRFQGFLASPLKGNGVVFHIQEFELESAPPIESDGNQNPSLNP